MDQVEVDVEQRRAALALGRPHLVRLPDLLEHRLGHQLDPPQAGGDHRHELRLAAAGILEVVRQVGVERDRVALARARARRRRRRAAARPSSDDRGLAAAGLVDRRVVRAAGGGAGRERVQRDLGALAGQRPASAPRSGGRRARPPSRRSPARTTRDAVALVEAQQLRERQLEARRDLRPRPTSVGLVSPRSTWDSIGAETPLRSARSRSDRSIASRSARDAIADASGSAIACCHDGCVRYHIRRLYRRDAWAKAPPRARRSTLVQRSAGPGVFAQRRALRDRLDDRRQRSRRSTAVARRGAGIGPARAADLRHAAGAAALVPAPSAAANSRIGSRRARSIMRTKCGSMTALVCACGVPQTRTIVWQTAWWTAKPAEPLA